VLIRRAQPAMGTYVTVSAYGSNHLRLQDAISAAFKAIHEVDERMSVHRPDSELSRVNAEAARQPVKVSPELFHVLAAALDISKTTRGAFDVTTRPLTDLWGFLWKKNYRLPTASELERVLPLVNFELIELDPANRTVRFLREGVSIDLGGIAKGYAVDRALETLAAAGITNAMVKAGGDLRVIGLPPGQEHWTVFLEDPNKRGARIQVRLRDAALSTSGDYENFFEVNGTRYSHILDPRTGMPVQGVAACTLVAPTCMESDAWATACMILGPDGSFSLITNRFSARFTLRSKARPDRLETIETADFPALPNP